MQINGLEFVNVPVAGAACSCGHRLSTRTGTRWLSWPLPAHARPGRDARGETCCFGICLEGMLSMETGLGIRPRYPPLHLRSCSGGNGAGASTASLAFRTLGDQRTATAFPKAAELELEGADRLSRLHQCGQSLSMVIFASGSARGGWSWAPCPLRQRRPPPG